MASGTLPMRYFQEESDGAVARVGTSYLTLQFKTVQAVFEGGFFDRSRQVAITSQVDVGYSDNTRVLVPAVQYAQTLSAGEPKFLGLERNLISTLPANITHLNISLDFTADLENVLLPLVSLINNGGLNPILSPVPGATQVVKAVGDVASQLMTALGVQAQSKAQLLSFRGTMNLQSDQFKSGYYVLIGASDDANLPMSTARITLDPEKRVLVNGFQPQHLSYAVLHAQVHKERTRQTVEPNTPWLLKLKQAEGIAEDAALSGAPPQERAARMKECSALIGEARVLLQSDPGFIESEQKSIIRQSFTTVRDLLLSPGDQTDMVAASLQPGTTLKLSQPFDGELTAAELELLDVSCMQELRDQVKEYESCVAETLPKLRNLGVLRPDSK